MLVTAFSNVLTTDGGSKALIYWFWGHSTYAIEGIDVTYRLILSPDEKLPSYTPLLDHLLVGNKPISTSESHDLWFLATVSCYA